MKFLNAVILLIIPLVHGMAIRPYQVGINNDPDFEKFLRESIENFRAIMSKGLPEIGLPVLDPLHETDINFNFNEEMAAVNLKLLEMRVDELSKFAIENIQADTDMSFHVEVLVFGIPSFGVYNVQGTVAKILPLWGNGNFSINVTEIDIVIEGKFISVNNNLQLKNLNLDLRWNDLGITLDNFLGGGDFSKTVQKMLPKLTKNVFEMYRNDILNYVDSFLLEKINEILRLPGIFDTTKKHHNS
ncbi:uncharacterized protein LOC129217129 [Uloborus diversus]|uniref:uncharacterized protein LOC129217129 n=1 Tax=Uloborus diversus TaxID=327109 RepID=UPI00240A3584|nr:uncharacterized protein LOC129217129 [Uloborus diversus]XP_054707362.1 uncharacterized protein LOC129217129 [Uloborus diversus]